MTDLMDLRPLNFGYAEARYNHFMHTFVEVV